MSEMDLTLLPQQTMKVSPRLVAANHILELSSMELQELIGQELSENPALEKMEEPTCPVCGAAMQGSICPHCLSQQKKDEPSSELMEANDEYALAGSSTSQAGDDEFDPLTQVPDQMTLTEYLLTELRAALPRDDYPIAEYLVGSLDERGWLGCSVREVADQFGTDDERILRVLRHLQGLEPIGIGARDLRECLLIQLAYLEEEECVRQPYAREIIDQYLTELGEHKFGKIAHALKISHTEVEAVWDFIKTHLNPYPAHLYAGTASSAVRDTRSVHTVPDVIINAREGQYEVDVLESKRYFLRVTPLYHQLASQVANDGSAFSDDEKRHILNYVNRAKLFIQNINQRRQTLQRITQCLVENQKDFLEYGIRSLRALTRAAVAAELGLHESTVSRATAHKFVMLPSRQVIPFSVFFSASLSVKDVIKEMIETENRPLTDQEIAHLLARQGINIARRTVAKYREQLGILPSPLR
ncbi:MAG: RNA polymerase factor sigma-54 [Chloroflexi bacterium]|nr:RNA polymerase factor sigma-54 [Chloroflexota bacterium]